MFGHINVEQSPFQTNEKNNSGKNKLVIFTTLLENVSLQTTKFATELPQTAHIRKLEVTRLRRSSQRDPIVAEINAHWTLKIIRTKKSTTKSEATTIDD